MEQTKHEITSENLTDVGAWRVGPYKYHAYENQTRDVGSFRAGYNGMTRRVNPGCVVIVEEGTNMYLTTQYPQEWETFRNQCKPVDKTGKEKV